MSFIEEEGKFPLIVKDPNAVLDYTWDWTEWLGPDNIATAVGAVVNGSVTITSTTNVAKMATLWLSGGVVGESCVVRCRITTSGGRTDDRSIRVSIAER